MPKKSSLTVVSGRGQVKVEVKDKHGKAEHVLSQRELVAVVKSLAGQIILLPRRSKKG